MVLRWRQRFGVRTRMASLGCARFFSEWQQLWSFSSDAHSRVHARPTAFGPAAVCRFSCIRSSDSARVTLGLHPQLFACSPPGWESLQARARLYVNPLMEV